MVEITQGTGNKSGAAHEEHGAVRAPGPSPAAAGLREQAEHRHKQHGRVDRAQRGERRRSNCRGSGRIGGRSSAYTSTNTAASSG